MLIKTGDKDEKEQTELALPLIKIMSATKQKITKEEARHFLQRTWSIDYKGTGKKNTLESQVIRIVQLFEVLQI